MPDREREPVLILGPEDRTRRLARRVALLEHRAIRAVGIEVAQRVLAAANGAIRVGTISTEHGLGDATGALRQLAAHAPGGPPEWIACGEAPHPAELAALRAAGVRLALLEPFSDEELRFVLNEALHAVPGPRPRLDRRVPTTLRARLETRGGEKTALVYSLSASGAYLATPRPTLRGGTVRLHLPLPAEPIAFDAEVVWNNVPGNLRRPNAPIGMGVRFAELPRDAHAALLRYLEERTRAYYL